MPFFPAAIRKRLQELADSLTAQDLLSCGRKWLAAFTPFFTAKERKVGCQHNLFFAQVEYCDNLVFRRRAALDRMEQRLLDENRNIGQPNKITAFDLGISTRTVEAHRANLMVKLQLHSLSDVLRLSFAAGLGATDSP